MKLLINASVLQSEGGVSLLTEILRHLPHVWPEIWPDVAPNAGEILLYLNPQLVTRLEQQAQVFLKDLPEESKPVITIVSIHPGEGWTRFWWEQVTLPRLIKREKADLLFSFTNTGPLFPGCPQVLYIQQSIPYTDYQPPAHRLAWKKLQWTFRLTMGLAQLGSRRIVAPTRWLVEPMRRSVFHRVPDSAYVVSPPGMPAPPEEAPPSRSTSHNYSEQQQQEERFIASVRRLRAKGQAILVYPCFTAPYKHIPYLIEAASWLERNTDLDFKLILTTDRHAKEYFPCKTRIFDTLQRLNPQNILLSGPLSRDGIAQLYRESNLLVFPSLVETLGLPLLEAMARDIPIVTTQTPFAMEICGEAALYADPANPEDFARKIQQVLSDTPLREALKVQARSQRLRYDWGRHLKAVFSDQAQ